jgi:competence protein ComEA
MIRKSRPDPLVGPLLLLFLLLALNRLAGGSVVWDRRALPFPEEVFVQVSGDIAHPGVYGFSVPPSLDRLIARAGGGATPVDTPVPRRPQVLDSGSRIELKSSGNGMAVQERTMSAFYRITLGIPVRVNCENREDLTAIPGVGCKAADAIVRRRREVGGFQELDQLLAVPGIGPASIRKMRPYVALTTCPQQNGGPGAPETERE